MTYRYTEEEIADIKRRQAENLSNFQRNSGRGLPAETVDAMAHARGVQMDDNGEPIPAPLLPQSRAKKRKPRAPKLPVPTEHEECTWLMKWAETQRFHGWPLSEILVHIPNGAYHGADREAAAVVAMKLRAQGLKAGVSDYILPVPIWTKKCPGLWVEMKRTSGGTVSEDQKTFQARMLELGWRCEIAKGWVEASEIIMDHLKSATPR